MTSPIRVFESHAVHITLNDIIALIEEHHSDNWDGDARSELIRLQTGVEHIKEIFKRAIPILITNDLLTILFQQLQEAKAQLSNFYLTRSLAHLHNANSYLSDCLVRAMTIPVVLSKGTDKSLSSVMKHYADQANAMLDSLSNSKSEVMQTIATLQRDAETISSNLKTQQETIHALSSQYQQQFSAQQEERRLEFAEKISEVQLETAETIKLIESQTDAVTFNLQRQINENQQMVERLSTNLLENLTEKNETASKLLELVGVKTQTYEFAAVSENENKDANFLRKCAIGIMLTAAVVLLVPAIFHGLNTLYTDDYFDWKTVLYRIPISLVLFAPAAYLASESSKHRKTAIENKRIEMELAALNPFMEPFTHTKKTEIKASLVEKYFVGHSRNECENSDKKSAWIEDALPKIIEQVVEKVLDKLPSFKKAEK